MRTSKYDNETLQRLLRERFQIDRFRPGQEEVISAVLSGRDTLAIMPSGSGKSLCYQLPSLMLDGTTVVVSPLISLMKDQVDKLEEAGVDADQVNSALSEGEEADVLEKIDEAQSDIVFTTPERLSDPEFIETLKQSAIDLLVVDEAHCISQWGHDFRPAFLEIGAAVQALGHPTVLALTATATDAVSEDIKKQLGTPDMRVINTGVYRPNLHYTVTQVTNEDEKLSQLLRLLSETDGPVILYAATIKAVEALREQLGEAGFSVAHYHGRLSAKTRMQNQDAFMNDQVRIMIATNAFGMGIDKPDVRAVIHYQMPASLEAYYQESGRAGRDGKASRCTLLYFHKDKRVQQFFLLGRYPDRAQIQSVYDALTSSAQRSDATTSEVLRAALPDLAASKLQVALKLLVDGGLVERAPDSQFRLRPDQSAGSTLDMLARTYEQKLIHDRETLERIVFYAQSGLCRWKIMLDYFGEPADWDSCGGCDNCRHPPEERLAIKSTQARHKPVRKKQKSPFEPGVTVRVPKFGLGEVTAVAGTTVTIDFPDGKSRSFLANYVLPVRRDAALQPETTA